MNQKSLFLGLCVTTLLITNACFFSEKPRISLIKTGNPVLLGTDATVDGYLIDSAGKVSEYGHCWSVQPDPTVQNAIASFKVKDKISNNTTQVRTDGSFTSQMTDLETNKAYYVKAFMIVDGKTVYSDQTATDATGQASPEINVKTISNVSVNNISKTEASLVSKIDGTSTREVTDYGFVYSTTSKTPTISNSTKVSLFDSTKPQTGTVKIDLSKTITGLIAGTIYYVRAYVITTKSTTNFEIYSSGGTGSESTQFRTTSN